MGTTILIRGARQLVTMAGPRPARRGVEQLNHLGIIADGAVLIRDGVIHAIGPTRRVENLAAARGAIEIEATGGVVMPGFVDCHTHLLGGAGDDGSVARAAHSCTAQRLQLRARAHLDAMSQHGTTTVEIKTGAGLDENAETKLLRVLSALHSDSIQIVPTLLLRMPPRDPGAPEDEAAAEAALGALLPKVRKRRQAGFADLAWNADQRCHEFQERYLNLVRSHGFGAKIHADQPEAGPAITAAVRHLAVSIDHLEHATPPEVLMLAGAPTMAVLLPTAALRGGRKAPGRTLLDAGAAVALASNFDPHHTPTLSMQTVVALASLYLELTPAEALTAATINAAHALGCAHVVGSLEQGKSADLVILKIGDYRELADNIGVNLVHMTIKGGKLVYQEGAVAAREVVTGPKGTLWPSRLSPDPPSVRR